MEPITMLAIAQASIQLYGLSRSSKAGIGGLLTVQTQLLKEIITQIGIINEKLDLIYTSISQLKEIVRDLPRENTLKLIKEKLNAEIVISGDQVKSYLDNLGKFGRLRAVSMSKDAANLSLSQLRSGRQVLINDFSDALIPNVAWAWYAEYQLLANCVPFDEATLETTIARYHDAFTRWSRGVETVLSKCDIGLSSLLEKVPRYQSRSQCYHSLQNHGRHWTRHGGGGVHGGGHVTDLYSVNIHGTTSILTGTRLESNERFMRYRLELTELQDRGCKIDRAFVDMELSEWTISTSRGQLFYVRETTDGSTAGNFFSSIANQTCDANSHTSFADLRNAEVKRFEEIVLRKIVYEHLLLVCRDVLSSIGTVHSRIRGADITR